MHSPTHAALGARAALTRRSDVAITKQHHGGDRFATLAARPRRQNSIPNLNRARQSTSVRCSTAHARTRVPEPFARSGARCSSSTTKTIQQQGIEARLNSMLATDIVPLGSHITPSLLHKPPRHVNVTLGACAEKSRLPSLHGDDSSRRERQPQSECTRNRDSNGRWSSLIARHCPLRIPAIARRQVDRSSRHTRGQCTQSDTTDGSDTSPGQHQHAGGAAITAHNSCDCRHHQRTLLRSDRASHPASFTSHCTMSI
jgi:hypothetical protein